MVDLPDDSASKESACSAGNIRYVGSIPGEGRSHGRGITNPLQFFLPEKSHGQSSLVGYSPKCHKEWDTTKQLSTYT